MRSLRHFAPPVYTDTELDREEWRPIAGYPGYEVSDLGRTRSFRTKDRSKVGRQPIGDTPKIIGGHITNSGHAQVLLCRPEDKPRWHKAHSLVLEAFIGPRPPGMEACHADGNPANNRLGNLRWDTLRANRLDAMRHGTLNLAKLAEEDIPKVWAALVAGERPGLIAKRFGVTVGNIGAIRRGTSWSHVTRHLPGWPIYDAVPRYAFPVTIPDEFCGAEEVWRSVPDWTAYRVSNHGRVASCWDRRGKVFAFEEDQSTWFMGDEWRIAKLKIGPAGHPWIGLRMPGKAKTWFVHSLVLTAFAGPRPKGMIACHIDGDPTNNHASNLRWDTHRSNHQDRIRHSTG